MTESVPSAEQYWRMYYAGDHYFPPSEVVYKYAEAYAALCVSAAVAQEKERCAKEMDDLRGIIRGLQEALKKQIAEAIRKP